MCETLLFGTSRGSTASSIALFSCSSAFLSSSALISSLSCRVLASAVAVYSSDSACVFRKVERRRTLWPLLLDGEEVVEESVFSVFVDGASSTAVEPLLARRPPRVHSRPWRPRVRERSACMLGRGGLEKQREFAARSQAKSTCADGVGTSSLKFGDRPPLPPFTLFQRAVVAFLGSCEARILRIAGYKLASSS